MQTHITDNSTAAHRRFGKTCAATVFASANVKKFVKNCTADLYEEALSGI
jgi:hypothetical protein